ncbi:hypothetical protein M569_15895 [Genlisea aurea]|uniref:Uncharacterized protein n=1 Tax=Genlisea aurea TaxID=192259 RepID=S8D8B7_9LAMI|nr:hypothetical protein M569_15895 [Genlisea aurea]
MGFLDKIWDDMVAGPAPENGLGKLRKYSSGFLERVDDGSPRHVAAYSRSNSAVRDEVSSAPGSPTATPTSPFSPSTPGGNVKKFTRRKQARQNPEWEYRTGYDW